jgi:hypothetical protein
MSRPAADGSIDVLLADGGHIVVDFEDGVVARAESWAADEIVAVLVETDGSEEDVERAIVEEAEAYGLTTSTRSEHHTTTVTIGSNVRY